MITDELELHEQEQPQTTDYQFVDGDLSEFQKEFSLPKQDMGISEEPDDSDEFIEDDYQEDEPTPPSAHVSRQTARFITNIIDSSAAFGLSLLSKNNIEQHKADKSAKSEIEKIIYVYVKDTGGNIPLWAQLTIILVVTYGLQIPQAIQDRKMNIEREKLEEERRELERQISEFEERKKIEKTKKTESENGSQKS